MNIQRWEDDYFRYEGDQVRPADDGKYVTYADHVAAVDAAVEATRIRAYTLMGDAIQNGIDNERQRIRFAVAALPLDNSGRVDYADLLDTIDEDES